jgi:saccharopine dehydrogenase-like NADP-dependent oxidoreductase
MASQMKQKSSVLILGDGRIGQAIAYYLQQNKILLNVKFFGDEKDVKESALLIGALPGAIGEQSLNLALKYKKSLIDVADIDPPFYKERKKEIEENNILVIPECGFSPGLVNFILGYEWQVNENIRDVEIKSGSLSLKKHSYPFLWCFEDLIAEHELNSWQLIDGEKVELPPFAGLRKERFNGIDAESYYCASGFEHLLDTENLKNFSHKVIRPEGYQQYFRFLSSKGFFNEENLEARKNLLEARKEDNLTLSEILFATQRENIQWQITSFSKRRERFNSMQKITAYLPVILAMWVLQKKLALKGLLFMEELGKEEKIFHEVIKEILKYDIRMTRKIVRGR